MPQVPTQPEALILSDALLESQSLLLDALRRTSHSVKLIQNDRCAGRLDPTDAMALVEAFPGRYLWTGSPRRVKKLLDLRPSEPAWLAQTRTWEPQFELCYRTAEAPVLQPSIDWLNSRLGA